MQTKWTLFSYYIATGLYCSLNCQSTFFATPSPEFYESDRNFLNFSVIDNPDIRRYTEEFNALCPYTDLCNVSVYYNDSLFKYDYDYYELPCCGRCTCGNNCLENLDCCIDILPRLLTNTEIKALHENTAKCIYTQYRPYEPTKYNGLAHILITECLESYTQKSIIEQCLKSYSEFDFASDIPEYLPVTDNRTMASYKNMFCGLCNNVPRSELIFWDAEVECNNFIVLDETETAQSLSEIEKFITRDARCNLVFKVPYYLQFREPFIEKCVPYIDKCNVTGLWQHYDFELESLCMSYMSSYKGYKNIHCYLCNGFNESTVKKVCNESSPSWRPSSFVSLMDFNNLEPSDEDENLESKEDDCAKGNKYDIWANVCRQLFCPAFTILKDGKCRPVFGEGTYDVQLRLIPKKSNIDVRIIPTLQTLIKDDVSRSMFSIKSADVGICNVNIFVKLNESLSRFKESLQQATYNYSYTENVSYVALRILISVQSVQNAKETINEITDRIFGQTFHILDAFQIYYFDSDFVLFERQHMFSPPFDETQPPGLYDRYRFFESYEDPIDGMAILPVLPEEFSYCSQPYRLLPFKFCPVIHLEQNDFHIQGSLLFLIQKGVYYNISDVIFSQNGSTITICSESYFSNEHNRKIIAENPNTAEFIVSLVCTSISLVFLFVVFLAYSCFKTLRTLPGLNNMALVLSLFFAQLFYLLGGGIEINDVWLCESIGLLLHLCLVASFFWMGICTFHMMVVFVFISKRSGTENTRKAFIRYVLIASIAAAIMVGINIIVSLASHDSGFGYGGQPCYITEKRMILFTVAIPLGVVIIGNFVMFLYVIVKVTRLPDVKKNTKHERRNIIIFAKLSTLTGLTWIFAYIYQWTGVQAFAYLFILANASQGLFIMCSFIINKRVYGMFNASLERSVLSKFDFSKTHSTSDGT